MAIDLLGRFQVAVDGQAVPEAAWPGRRSRELVQLLALARGRALLRDQVVEALWPHLGPDAGAANLRKAAHHVRTALRDPEAIVLSGGTVRLLPAREVSTDVEAFRRAAAEAAHDPAAAGRVAESYGGELLPDARYEPWCEADRESLRAVHLRMLRTAGRWADVVEIEPTDEEAYQHLMRAALAGGSRSAAIRWYGRLRSTLARDLGVRPADESRRIYQQCMDGLLPDATAFVGRQLELATVTTLLGRPRTSRAAAIVVRGPGGIGKSALCDEVARLATASGWSCVRLDGSGSGEPYGPMRAGIETLAGDRELLGGLEQATRSTLTRIAGLPGHEAGAGPLGRHQVIGAFRRLVTAAAGGRPVLVALDDAHAADDATLDALAQLPASGGDLAVLLAARTEPANAALDRVVARLTRAGRAAVVDLGPLDEPASRSLAAGAAPEDLEPAVLDRIVELAAGNPFFTVELARGAAPDQPESLSPDVGRAITARLVDLDAGSVELLRRVALVGDELDSDRVVALTGLPEPDAFALLDEALDAGVLVVGDGRFRFRHDLVRQALVAGVAPHERLAVHRDAARRLAAAGAGPAVVARHWVAGGRPADAVPFQLAAARRAVDVGAFRDALDHLTALLATEPMHAEARRLRAEALDLLGDVAALPAYDEAIEVCPAEGADDLRAKRALAQLKQGDPTGALRALDGVTPTSIDGRLAEALTYSGAAALGFIDPATGTEKSAECRRTALRSGDAGALVVASWAQAAAAHARGRLRESVLADLRDTSDVPQLALRVFDGQLCVTQRLLYGTSPYDDVIAFADSLAREAARLGAARGHAFGVTLRGEAELLSGRLDEAERDLGEGARLHRAIGGATGEALALQRLAELALQRGQSPEAAALLDEALDLARSTDIGFHLLDRIYGTRISLARDPAEALLAVEEAEDAVRGPLETCPGCRITFAVPAAIAAARAGDLDRAAEYERACDFLAHYVMRAPAWHGALDEVRAHLALGRGDHASAAALFASAAAGFRTAGQPADAARCARLAEAGADAPAPTGLGARA